MLANGYVNMLIDGNLSMKDWFRKVVSQDGERKLSLPVEPDPYYSNCLAEVLKDLDEFNAMSDEDLMNTETLRRNRRLMDIENEQAKEDQEWKLCSDMKEQLEAWQAPEPLADLRQYMLASLNEALSHGMLDYYDEERAHLKTPIDIQKLRAEKIEYFQYRITYFEARLQEQQQRELKETKFREALSAL